ncbi:MAG: rubrerythrin family protein [Candidatus Lokiarchaeota archaeon]|nr:rubrerythrin family protein [Candidatus Lokiarchaeota archaeon]
MISTMKKTIKHLKDAITGEFNAINKYKKYAEVAEQESLPNIARIFRALVEGENVHLNNHKRALKLNNIDFEPEIEEIQIGTTMENLKESLKGETYEFEDMYPGFIKNMKSELNNEDAQVAELSFEWAKEVEMTHAETLQAAIDQLNSGKDFSVAKIWVCRVCGNLVIDEKPTDVCPVCKHDVVFYKEVE